MKLEILVIGKTKTPFLISGIDAYLKRLAHYIPCRITELADVKLAASTTQEQQKSAEGIRMLQYIEQGDMVILLDEHGSQPTSREFAAVMQKHMYSGVKRVIYVIGGPYGFSPEMYARANARMSLSRMTFPHDMVRLIFVEQLYRAMTILRGEPYHHD